MLRSALIALGLTLPLLAQSNVSNAAGTVIVTQTTAASLKVDLSGTAANATALKVDGSAVTQPVSGTIAAVTAITNALPTGTNTLGSVKLTDGTTTAIINSAANQAATTANGAQLVEKGPRWRVTSTPAVSVVASASKTAGSTGVRHVADCISFSAGATTAPSLTKLNINLRDGATGAGTIIWSYTVVIPAATGQSVAPFRVCGLNLVGTSATAMTLEFSALLTSLFEDVSISGYDVN